MSTPYFQLQQLFKKWDDDDRSPQPTYSYSKLFDEIYFHAQLRYSDYIQAVAQDGEFPSRLIKWLNNVDNDELKKAMLILLDHFVFVDRLQMQSLYRDVFRQIILPWLSVSYTRDDELSPDYLTNIISDFRHYRLLTITESFDSSQFIHVNPLSGISRTINLNDSPDYLKQILSKDKSDTDIRGIILLEDFVGSASQSQKMLKIISNMRKSEWRILFAPLIMLECGFNRLLQHPNINLIDIMPVMIVPDSSCVTRKKRTGEPAVYSIFRSLINHTENKVIMNNGANDVPPRNSFGFDGTGAIFATCHNTPNNTLPIIHHHSPEWFALFRRTHHKK